jgi:surface antigen
MQARGAGAKTLIFGSFLFLTCQFAGQPADASTTTTQQRTSTDPSQQTTQASARRTAHAAAQGRFAAHGRQYARAGGISCVPFARADSGISVAGNAWEWWDNAAGVYARGSLPEAGSVLTFRSNGRMRLGHVAVVSRVINPREIEIEHANWWGPAASRATSPWSMSPKPMTGLRCASASAGAANSAPSIRPTGSSTTVPTAG